MGLMDVRIAPLDLSARVDDALRVEAAAFARTTEPFRRASYLRHTTYADFAALAALRGSSLVGFAYGHRNEPGQWWHDQIARPLLAAGHGRWLDDVFALVELHVLPEFQRRGIGRTLLTQLVAGRSEARVLLSTHDLDTPARRFYRRIGFAELLTDFRFEGSTRPFVVMGATLPLAQGT